MRAFFLAVTLIPLLSGPPADAEVRLGQSIEVRVINSAKVSAARLRKGMAVAQGLFLRAGVPTSWRDCTAADAPCKVSPADDARVIYLRVLSARQVRQYGLPRSALGAAILPPDDFGRLANAFAARADQIARWSGVDATVALGCLLAHEVGHLLLDRARHSDAGLMQSAWTEADLRGAARGELGFLEAEAASLRSRVSARLRTSYGPDPLQAALR